MEYRRNKEGKHEVYHVESKKVDDKEIKQDTYYTLYKKQFREVITCDGIDSAILLKKGSVFKVWNLGKEKESYVVADGENFSHGNTIKEARENLIYKISNRDTSKYNDLPLDTKMDKKEYIEMYRVITGACQYGVKNFVESNNNLKKEHTIQEIINITQGQYGNKTLTDFFKGE